jgi:hypothetical protein
LSPEISTLVSEYADYLDEIAPPVTVEELEAMVGQVPLRSTESQPRRGWLVAAAAAVVVLLAGGIVVWAQRPERSQSPVVTQPDPVVTTLPPTTTTLPETSQTTLPPPDATPGSGLGWQRVALEGNAHVVFDGGDRFMVPVDDGNGVVEEVRTSFDGITWVTRSLPRSLVNSGDIRAVWEDSLLVVTGGGGFSTTEDGPIFTAPSNVAVLGLDGTATQHLFESDVRSAAIGPAGIVVGASSFLDEEEIVHNELGADFASNLSRTELREDDVLYAETTDGQTAEIPLVERGYDPEALGRVDGWHSSDGQDWFPIFDFPPVDSLIGTRDGFVGIKGTNVWHSIDGRSWQSFGSIGFLPVETSPFGLASRWKDGALITDGSGFVYVSASGLEPLPAPPDAISNSNSAPWPLVATGDVGIAYVSARTDEFLFSADGVSWETNSLPADMADSFGWFTSSAAATDTAVLLLLWDETGGEQEPVWWLGTLP